MLASSGELDQSRHLRIRGRGHDPVGTADDEQPSGDTVDLAKQRDRLDHRVDALSRHDPSELKDDRQVVRQAQAVAGARLVAWMELVWVETARDDRDARRIGAVEPDEVVLVLWALRDDPVGRGDHRGLDVLAFRWKAVRGALMHPAHLAERVERDHEGDAESTPKFRRDLTRHEEVRVHQVVASAAGRPVARHPADELRHVFEQSAPWVWASRDRPGR